MTILPNQLAVLNLIACDYSYNPNPAVPGSGGALGGSLASFPDSNAPEFVPPVHLFANVGLGYQQVGDVVSIDGWRVAGADNDPATGFSFVVFQNADKTDAIIAMTGTNGPDAQDWYSNLNLGVTQWSEFNRPKVLTVLNQLKNADGTRFTGSLNFTGQSLGGGLAQYALYDFQANKTSEWIQPNSVTLTTYNAFGGLDGLQEIYRSGFNPSFVSGVSTRHYVTGNDLVSRLGGGHLNGAGNTYLLDFKERVEGGLPVLDEFGNVAAVTADFYHYPDLVDAHRIESGFYRWFAEQGTDFSYARPHTIDYIEENAFRALGAAFSSFLNDDDHGPAESALRSMSAVATMLALGDPGDLKEAGTEMLAHVSAASESAAESMLWKAFAWSAPTIFVGMARHPAAKATLLTLMLGTWAAGAAADTGESMGSYIDRLRSAIPDSAFALDYDMLNALSAADSPGEGALKAAFAIGLLGGSLPGGSDAFAGFDVDTAELGQALASENWTSETFGVVARAASAAGMDVAPILSAAASGLYRLLQELTYGAGGESMLERLKDEVGDGLADVAKAIANGFVDRIADFADTSVEWLGDVSRSLLDDIEAELKKLIGDEDLPTGFSEAYEAIRDTAQAIIVHPAGGNPFAGDVDPDTVEGSSLIESTSRYYTVSLPYAAGEGGQRVRLALSGADAGSISIMLDSGRIDLGSDGQFEITIPEGKRDYVFGIDAGGDVDADSVLTLSATLIDADGNATHRTHDEISLDLDATDEAASAPPQTTRDILGDLSPIDFSGDPGIQSRNDDLGNVITDPAKAEPGRVDTLYDSDGNDRISAGAGDDIVWNIRGGDDLIDLGDGDDYLWTDPASSGSVLAKGGAGRDYLGAGSGRDIVEGGEGADGLYGSSEDDQLYGDEKGETADLIAAGGDQLASGAQGEWVDAEDGNDQVFTGAGNDFVAGGNGDDLIVTGGGTDWIWGDWNTWSQGFFGWRDWTVTERIETGTNGGKTYYYDISAIYGESNAGAGDDAIYAGAGDDVVMGDGGNDTIRLEAGDDKSWGGEGSDVILGGDGNDLLNGDNGDEFLDSALHGNDYLDGGSGDDKLLGMGGSDTLMGGDGNDALQGDNDDENAGEDYLDGEGGDDRIFGGALSDTIYGGAGNDILVGDHSDTASDKQGDDYLDGEEGDDELYGGGGADILLGGDGADRIWGDGSETAPEAMGADYLDGGDGDDQMVGLGGADILIGGNGNDLLWGDDGGTPEEAEGDDQLLGGAGNDQLVGNGGDDYLDGGDGVDMLIGGKGHDVLMGGAGVDRLQGGEGDDTLDGGADSDTLFGGDGNDTLVGGDGKDYLLGGAGDDVMNGGEGDDYYYISNNEGYDHIVDSGGTDWLVLTGIYWQDLAIGVGSLKLTVKTTGQEIHLDDFDPERPLEGAIEYFQFGDGTVLTRQQLIQNLGFDIGGTPEDDELVGTALGDRISALAGNDYVLAGAGNDTIDLGAGNDWLDAGDGNDTVQAGEGADLVRAGMGSDLIDGGADDDVLYGEAGDDRLLGGDGNDYLVGGTGNDILQGGAGDDLYVFGRGDGQDRASDSGGANTLMLNGLTADEVTLRRQGNDLIVSVVGTTDRLTAEGWFADAGTWQGAHLGDGVFLDRAAIDDRLISNQVPIVQDDAATVREDGTLFASGNVLANDLDPEGRTLAVSNPGSRQGTWGSLSLQANGSYTYTLNNAAAQSLGAGQQAVDSFSYSATDNDPAGAQTAAAQLRVTVIGANDVPVTVADSAGVSEDGVLQATGNVLANDRDIDAGTTLTVFDAGVRQGVYGTLTLGADGAYRYALNNDSAAVQSLGRNQVVSETFAYRASDGLASTPSQLVIGVSGRNDAPILVAPLADQSATTNKDWLWQVPADSFRDPDANDTLTWQATLADGSALPDWLSFDAATRTFSGRVPRTASGLLDIAVRVSDGPAGDGVSLFASDVFQLAFDGATHGGGGGGNGGGGGGSSGNEGVGNGEDPPPPGHDANQNDGPGTSPGDPGAQGGLVRPQLLESTAAPTLASDWERGRLAPATAAVIGGAGASTAPGNSGNAPGQTKPASAESSAGIDAPATTAANGNAAHEASTENSTSASDTAGTLVDGWGLPASPIPYLNSSHWSAIDTGGAWPQSGSADDDTARRWREVFRLLAERLDAAPSDGALDDAQAGFASPFNLSGNEQRTAYGADLSLLPRGQALKVFQGLAEGLDRIA